LLVATEIADSSSRNASGFISTRNETLSATTMFIRNEDYSPVGIHG
jgi:hypothetical protein